MLEIYTSLKDFSFEKLMFIYRESNEFNGAERYTDLNKDRQIQCAENDFYDYLIDTFFSVRESMYCVWVKDNQYLSALRLEPFLDGYLLEALETAPAHRRKGFGKLLVQSVIEHLQTTNPKPVYSHIHKRNMPSLSLHKSCGFQIVSDSATYIDGTVSSGAYTLRFDFK